MMDFYGKRRIYYCISLGLILIGIISLFVGKGVQLDITFSGGAKITYSYSGSEMDVATVEALVKDTLGRDSTVQNAQGYQNDETSLVISMAGTQNLTTADQDKLYSALNSKYPDSKIQQGSTTNIEASIGRHFLMRGLTAILIAAIFIIIYVTIRFSNVSGFTAALTAMIALLHDITIVFFLYVVAGIPINDGFIAVVLTILGNSVNNTVVIFDRIRENKHLTGNKLPLPELVNKSIKQSMTRTINTTVASTIAIFLVFVFGSIKNITSVVDFALPMMVSMIVGCYSSNLLAPALWCSIKSKKKAA